ncbi:nitrate reductase [Campylobacter jejuni]|nr:nitrate reductase [Campylobacter jejuni]
MNEKNHLLEEAILPVWNNQRTIGFLTFIWMWISMAVIIATFSLGETGIKSLALWEVIGLIFLANVAIAIVMVLVADIGTEHGLSFSVYLRAPFGIKGTHLPSIARGIGASIWFGIQTYLGALALNGISEYLFGFNNWFIWYIIFAAVQIISTGMGIRTIKLITSIAAPCIIAVTVWMYFTLDVMAQTKGINIWSFAGTDNINLLVFFFANMSFWSALAIDIPNLTRFLKTPSGEKNFFKRNKNVFIAQLIALPMTQAWIGAIGAISFIATGIWNPIEVIQNNGTGFTMVVLLVMVILSQWSTNAPANLIPAALAFINAGAPKLHYFTAVVISGIAGTIIMPWLILDNLFIFLGYYGAVLSGIGGIIVADYYVLRKRRLNVPHLYSYEEQFVFAKGFNWAGLIAWAVGGVVAIALPSISYLVGFVVGFVVYLFVMKTWILPKYPQVELENLSDDFLGTSADMNWVYENENFKRVASKDLVVVAREDR